MSNKRIFNTKGDMVAYENDNGSWIFDQSLLEKRNTSNQRSSGGSSLPGWANVALVIFWSLVFIVGAFIVIWSFLPVVWAIILSVVLVLACLTFSISMLGISSNSSKSKRKKASESYREEMRRRYG